MKGGLDLGVEGILGRAQLAQQRQIAPNGDVEEVAKQFESVMLQQMVSALRRAAVAPGQEEKDDNQLVEHLIDEGLATHLARSGGIGLAKMIAEDARRASGKVESPVAHELSGLRRDQVLTPAPHPGDDGSFELPSPEALDGDRPRADAAEVLERMQRFERAQKMGSR